MSVAPLIAGKRVVICAGSGGVGKTTTSAALAAGIAARGSKTIVVTIDPARRLADSLGLPALGNEAHRVEPALLAAAGIAGDGELWAMTLDPKQTFDDVVRSQAPDDATRDAVLANPIYRELSNAIAGSQEYMAMEKLHELHAAGDYDVLVLDTPPTRNALDFLDAPTRLARFVDSRSLQFFRATGGIGILGRGTGLMFSILKRATGIDLLEDLAEFFNSFGEMAGGFRDRARAVEALIADDATTFLLVTSPRTAAIEEATHFFGKLAERGLPFGGAIANRVREPLAAPPAAVEDELARAFGPKLAAKVVRTLTEHERLAARDAHNLAALSESLGGAPVLQVPELAGDVHDLAGLAALGRHLF